MACIRGKNDTERAQFDFELNEPPEWDNDAALSDEALASDAGAFMAAMSQFKKA